MFNANTKVERHSFGISKLPELGQMSSGVAAHDYLQKKAVLEHYEQIDKNMENVEKQHKEKEAIEKVTMSRLYESQIPQLVNQLHREGKEIIFKEILFEMFSKSLYLDEEFVIKQEDNLRALVESYVSGKGGYALLEKSFAASKSPFLKKIMSVCESTAGKVSRRKMKEAQEQQLDVSAIKFELNDEEKEELEYSKEKISVDELSDLVKKKVLTVIQDEKTRQAKEEELYNDLEQQAAEEGGDDANAVKESMKRATITDMPVEESTLFNSLLRHSMKELIHENSSHQAFQMDEDADPSEEYDIDANTDDVSGSEYQGQTTVRDEANAHGSVQSDIDMDLILAEAMTKYTLMELCYTIQLESYSYDELRKISQSLLN